MIDRQKTHGDWNGFAKLAQSLKVLTLQNKKSRTDSQNECIDMICHKLARIITGDPNHLDHWEDIQGYCERVIENLKGDILK